jgi:hypothetical protein
MGVCHGVATGQGLPKASLGPSMLYPSMVHPVGGPPLQGFFGRFRVAVLWPSSTPLDTQRRTPLVNELP